MPTVPIFNQGSALEAAASLDFTENVTERLHKGDSLRLGIGDAECRMERSEHIDEIIRTSQELGLYD